MLTVQQVSRRTGVSVRTLQYYDQIGLLKPAERSESGYRLYDDGSLERLQLILLYKMLEFSLKDIRAILDAPDFDRNKALGQQIKLLTLKREHLQNLIEFAHVIKTVGVRNMSFEPFDTKKLDEYAAQAKAEWGRTPAYAEYERKFLGRSAAEQREVSTQMMALFTEFGALREGAPASPEAQALVAKLQDFITRNFYTCTDEILMSLGRTYTGGGDFTANIDSAGGPGTAAFAQSAIEIYCRH